MEIYYSFEAELVVYITCRCMNNPPPYSLCSQTNISHIYGYFNCSSDCTRELTGRTVSTIADIAKKMNNVILRMDAVAGVVRLGIRQILAKHT